MRKCRNIPWSNRLTNYKENINKHTNKLLQLAGYCYRKKKNQSQYSSCEYPQMARKHEGNRNNNMPSLSAKNFIMKRETCITSLIHTESANLWSVTGRPMVMMMTRIISFKYSTYSYISYYCNLWGYAYKIKLWKVLIKFKNNNADYL